MKDENQIFLTRLADFFADDDGEGESLSPEEEERASSFVSMIKTKIATSADEQRTRWIREAEESRTNALRYLEKANIVQPERDVMLSRLNDSSLLAARGMERGLKDMSNEELFELYQSQLEAEMLDEMK